MELISIRTRVLSHFCNIALFAVTALTCASCSCRCCRCCCCCCVVIVLRSLEPASLPACLPAFLPYYCLLSLGSLAVLTYHHARRRRRSNPTSGEPLPFYSRKYLLQTKKRRSEEPSAAQVSHSPHKTPATKASVHPRRLIPTRLHPLRAEDRRRPSWIHE